MRQFWRAVLQNRERKNREQTTPGVALKISSQGQELRGGSLDHECREMSETRETANADRYQAIPGLAGDIAPFDDAQGRLRQGGRFLSFS
jgi:hypothetical protein